MAKQNEYFYECIREVDVAFRAPAHRPEFRQVGRRPPDIDHMYRFKPDRGRGKPAMILQTKEPIAKHFLELSRTVKVKKSMLTGTERTIVSVHKPKFRLVPTGEVTESMRARAFQFDDLRPCDTQAGEVAPVEEKAAARG